MLRSSGKICTNYHVSDPSVKIQEQRILATPYLSSNRWGKKVKSQTELVIDSNDISYSGNYLFGSFFQARAF